MYTDHMLGSTGVTGPLKNLNFNSQSKTTKNRPQNHHPSPPVTKIHRSDTPGKIFWICEWCSTQKNLPMRSLSMAYSRCPMLTQSAPSLAAFRAAWFTTVLMSAPKTVQKRNVRKQNVSQKLLLKQSKNKTLDNRTLLINCSTNCSKTEHYSEITNTCNTLCRNAKLPA